MKGILLVVITVFCLDVLAQPATNNDSMIIKKTFVYKTVGHTSIHADFYESNTRAQPKPVIVWIHGGALMFGSREDIPAEQLKFYLKAGFSLVSIDYRLAPETKLPAIVKDVSDAIQWVRSSRQMLNIDPNRVFVIGHSGGAYLALMTGTFRNGAPNAIVSFYGYGNIMGDWYNKPNFFAVGGPAISKEEAMKLIRDSVITTASVNERLGLYAYSRQNGVWPVLVSGRNPAMDPKWFDSFCPVKNIRSNYPPVLLIHGDKDMDVPIEESIAMDKELSLKKVKHQFIQMKNYGHLFDLFQGGFSNPDVYKVFVDAVAFLNSAK